MARAPWLPGALAVLILLVSWARRGAPGSHKLPGWGLAALVAATLALVAFLAVARPWHPAGSLASVEALNASLVWQAGLALLAAVTIAAGGGWLARRLGPRASSQALPRRDFHAEHPVPAPQPDPLSLPPLFLAEGARVLVTGPSRSGKSTVLHHLCRAALADPTFDEIVLLDGKGPELIAWSRASSEVSYHGPEDIAAWVAPLERIARGFPARYNELVKAGRRKADVTAGLRRDTRRDTRRKLIVIDEVQQATRAELGKKITAALLTISEQSGALGDVLVITTQRATHHSLDKSISYNANVIIALTSPDHPGRFELYGSLEQKRPFHCGQARPASDEDIAAWAAEIGSP